MRLRVYHAATAAAAMAKVRSELGDNAVIVATQDLRDGRVRVTAAAENGADDLHDLLTPGLPEPVERMLGEAMAVNEVPADLAAQLLAEARAAAADETVPALSQALATTLPFAGICNAQECPIMLVGPPGAGKTATAAKLAARAVLAGHSPIIVSTDTARAGGTGQLETLIQPLGLELRVATDHRSLRQLLKKLGDTPVIIDAAAINPFRTSELAGLSAMVEAGGVTPVAVLAGGGSTGDAAEMATNLAAVGARRMIVTCLDVSRRLGGMLAAAKAGLALCEVSISPLIARGLNPLTPTGLARLMLRQQSAARATTAKDVSA